LAPQPILVADYNPLWRIQVIDYMLYFSNLWESVDLELDPSRLFEQVQKAPQGEGLGWQRRFTIALTPQGAFAHRPQASKSLRRVHLIPRR